MTYEPQIDVVAILKTTQQVLESSQYPEKYSACIQALVSQIQQCIAELEAIKIPPARHEPNDQATRASATIARNQRPGRNLVLVHCIASTVRPRSRLK